MNELILGLIAVFLGGLVQGCMGFGFAMVIAPILILFLPHDQVPPIITLLSIVNNILILIEARSSVRLRMVLPLIIGGVIGLPIGGYILVSISPVIFKIAVGCIILTLAVVMLAGWRRRVRNEVAGLVPVGMLSGLLSSSTSIGGPPLVLFFSSQGYKRDTFRANIIAYAALSNVGSVIVYLFFDLLNREVLTSAGTFFLPALIGTLVGVRLAKLVNEKLFGKIVLILIIILSVILVISNLPV